MFKNQIRSQLLDPLWRRERTFRYIMPSKFSFMPFMSAFYRDSNGGMKLNQLMKDAMYV